MQFGHEFSKYLKWNWMSPFFAPPWRMNCLICILVHLMLNPCNNVCWSRNILIILPWYVVPKWQDTKFTVCFSFLCLLGSDISVTRDNSSAANFSWAETLGQDTSSPLFGVYWPIGVRGWGLEFFKHGSNEWKSLFSTFILNRLDSNLPLFCYP